MRNKQANVTCLVHKENMEDIRSWELVYEGIMSVVYEVNEMKIATVVILYGPNESAINN